MSSIIIFFLFAFVFECYFAYLQINQTIFRSPDQQFQFIRCPLEWINSWDIRWYDVDKQRYDDNRGRFYRIDLQEEGKQRELICWGIHTEDQVKFLIRIYDRPFPIEDISMVNITNTSLTIQWKDHPLNSLANITGYELILKYDHWIQSRILVNHSLSMYTFSSLHSGIFYSIELSVLDQWKRSSTSKTLLRQTLPLQSQKKIFVNRIIDAHLLDHSIDCYNLQSKYLFIELNTSAYEILNQIYNLTIFDGEYRIVMNRIVYSSLIYSLEEHQGRYTIELSVSTSQSEYLGKIGKICREFYPMYSPIICTRKFIEHNQIHLFIYHHHRQIQFLHSNRIYYPVNESYMKTMEISDIHHYRMDRIELQMENYSITMENDLLGEVFNLSIICSSVLNIRVKRFSNGLFISLIFFVVILFISTYLIFHRIKKHQRMFESIPIDRFISHVSFLHRDDNLAFKQLFQHVNHDIDLAMKKSFDSLRQIDGYIASQQPVIDTITKFWRMIWEKDVNVIVMMTNSNNRGNTSWIYTSQIDENLCVTLNGVEVRPYYFKRIFTIRYRCDEKFIENERDVYLFDYTHWVDGSVPDYPLSFLSFVRVSSFLHSKMGGPMVVCSSNGLGSYIVIDTMLKMLIKERSFAIPSFVKHIREQGDDLVRSEDEFIFIYDVLRDAIESYEGDLSKIDKQFQSFGKKINRISSLHGYHRIDEYLITKHPNVFTRNEFWKTIWDNQTEIIVALYAEESMSMTGVFDYCPLTNEMLDCGNDIHVCLLDEHFQCEYIYRDCLVESIEKKSPLFVQIISTSYWPETCSPIERSFDLIEIIRNLRTSKPIVVHDLLGGHRAATFCVLYTLKEQIEHGEVPNIYELAKFYSIKRPGIWRNIDDLLFLYRCCAKVLFQG